MWDLILTGAYAPRRILDIATDEWGLRTIKRKRTGGTPCLQRSLQDLHEYLLRRSPGVGGQGISGKAPGPWLTIEEFDRVQHLLGLKGRPRPKTHLFAFTGMIRCGECGLSVVAEERSIATDRTTPTTTAPDGVDATGAANAVLPVSSSNANPTPSSPSITSPDNLHQWRFRDWDALNEQSHDMIVPTPVPRSGGSGDQPELGRTSTSLRLRDLITDQEFIAKRQELPAGTATIRQHIDATDHAWALVRNPPAPFFPFSKHAAKWFCLGSLEQNVLS